jgi:rhodanese-related sulfurtransferase/DNA-binding transcriptional ArsR family regulator
MNPKREVLTHLATMAKAFAHPNRLELLELVAQGERSVEALAQVAGLTIGNTSQHLQQLRRSGLLATRRQGKQIFYRLADDAVVDMLVALRRIAEHNVADVQRVLDGYFHDRDSLDPVSRDELVARVQNDEVTVLDVRPEDEFSAGHLPDALNIPLKQLNERLKELPAGKEVIAYCRGPYCVYAFEAVAALRERGIKARRLEDGYPEWRAAGRPVESEPGGG